MDSNLPVSPETTQPDVALDLAQVKHELELAEGKIMRLELALLQSRDFAIGAAAAAGESPIFRIRAMYVEAERQLGDANTHIKSHLAHIQRLEQVLQELPKNLKTNQDLQTQIDILHNSATWKIGRLLLLPIRVIKRVLH